jgi:hypothetical protein
MDTNSFTGNIVGFQNNKSLKKTNHPPHFRNIEKRQKERTNKGLKVPFKRSRRGKSKIINKKEGGKMTTPEPIEERPLKNIRAKTGK